MTTKHNVGDSVIANGYLGTVTAVLEHGGIAVRLERGEIEIDGSDVLPGSLWPQLCKMGESDARKARKEGSILIAQTSRGTVDLRYSATDKRFEGTCEGGRCVVNARTIKAAGVQLASLYRVEMSAE